VRDYVKVTASHYVDKRCVLIADVRITYIHQYFTTPAMAGGTRSYEMARRFVVWGHEVHMVTSDTRPDTMRRGWYHTEEAGIQVHWLPVPYSNYMGFRERMKAFAAFAMRAGPKAASLNGDVIFATSTPLTVALPAVYAAKRTKRPMVFEVRDLWPEAPIQQGALRAAPLVKAALWLEGLAYKNATHIVALSPGMRDGVLDKGVAADKVSMIPNSSDLDLFHPDIDGGEFRKRLGTEGKVVFLFFGAFGVANGLGFVLDAAAELKQRGRDDIAFVLHGDGKERPGLMARREAEGLDNVVFSEQNLHKQDVARLVAAADVCMTIYMNLPIQYTCSPNKMFDSLAAGKPVLTNMPGWLQSLVEDHEAGVFVEPDNARDFADKAIFLADHPEFRASYGKNARRLAEERFARDKLARELESILVRAAQAKRPVETVGASRPV
jgi:glycosyltransferase involved in cell wall biosynthesis